MSRVPGPVAMRSRCAIVGIGCLALVVTLFAISSVQAQTGLVPDAPTAAAVYSTSTTNLEIRWSSSDFADTTGFRVQWKSGAEDYDTTRQASVDPATSQEPDSSTISSRRYKHELTGLTDDTEYTVRVIASNSHGDSTPSSEATGTPQSAPGQVRELIENEVVKIHEADFPWLREAWTHITDQGHNITIHPRTGSGVSIWCSPHRPLEDGLRKCYAESVSIGRESASLIRTITGVLARVYTLANGVASTPGPLGIAHLYVHRLGLRGANCSPAGLYADLLTTLVHEDSPHANRGAWERCSGTTESMTQEALAVVGSAAAGEMPSWLASTYNVANGNLDLERVWAHIKAMPSLDGRTAVVFQLRDAFGGYCDNYWADVSAFSTSRVTIVRNPWADGGCTPTAPRSVGVTATGDGKLTVSWRPPVSDGGMPIEGFKVQWKSGSQDYDEFREATALSGAQQHLVGGLTNGTPYTLRVLGYNRNGDGAASAEVTSTPAATDTTAPALVRTWVVGDTLGLTYNEALDETSQPATGDFTVNVAAAGRGVSNVAVSGNVVTLTLTSAPDVG